MKLKRFFIALCTLLSISSGCEDGCEFSEMKWRCSHLIAQYMKVEGVRLESMKHDSYPNVMIQFRGGISCPSQELYDEVMRWVNTRPYLDAPHYCGDESYIAMYKELAQKNGDYGFSQTFSYSVLGDLKTGFPTSLYGLIVGARLALDKGLSKIEVTSESDFDQAHPAGKSLNDIAYIEFYSYAESLDTKINPKTMRDNIMSKRISDLTAQDIRVIGNHMTIRFPDVATPLKTHNITVTITFDDGEVLSDSVQVDF